MKQITAALLVTVADVRADNANIKSVVDSLNKYAKLVGLDQPHRLIQFLAQIAHESGGFRYDQELWGPTAAQKRYDTRTDLGNTPEADGDGYKYRGRTAMQLTGRRNYLKFYQWCVSKGLNPPDFVEFPDLVNTDPWEGLVPIWYWDVATGKSLNVYADQGDNEMITRKINGGTNGLDDRLEKYSRLGLAYLGYDYTPSGIRAFQTVATANGWYTRGVDGEDGPGTRAAIHQALVREGTIPVSETKPAPVTENVAVAPQGGDKTAMTRIFGAGGFLSMLLGFFADLPPELKVGLAVGSAVAFGVLVWKAELVASRIKSAIKAFGIGN